MGRKKSKYEIVAHHETCFEVIDRETNEMYERFSTYDVGDDGSRISAKDAYRKALNFKQDLETEDKQGRRKFV